MLMLKTKKRATKLYNVQGEFLKYTRKTVFKEFEHIDMPKLDAYGVVIDGCDYYIDPKDVEVCEDKSGLKTFEELEKMYIEPFYASEEDKEKSKQYSLEEYGEWIDEDEARKDFLDSLYKDELSRRYRELKDLAFDIIQKAPRKNTREYAEKLFNKLSDMMVFIITEGTKDEQI